MSVKINVPHRVAVLLDRLRKSGHRADIVGGCVRDSMLGKTPNDYDITTSATPEQMKQAFFDMHVIETGIKHGTVTVMLGREPYEITTYRVDGEYTDGRHPDSVTFTDALSDDLARRDFTVNAMAYNPIDGLTDLYGGADDIDARTIRAVGDAERRFSEDALRIIRALRFASVLNFQIEPSTAAAIFKKRELLSGISRERIFAEWTRLIGGESAYGILKEYREVIAEVIPQLSKMHLPREELFLSASAEARELSLFSKYEMPSLEYDSAMRGLRADNKRRLRGISVLGALDLPHDTEPALLRILRDVGEESALLLIELKILLGTASENDRARLISVTESGACHELSELAVNGYDMRALGLVGKEIGAMLGELLSLVIDGKLPNEREALLDKARIMSNK